MITLTLVCPPACGACCQGGPGWHVPLTHRDLVREPRLRGAMSPGIPGEVGQLADLGPCAFLVGDQCGIYATRPEACQAFRVGGRGCLERRGQLGR